MNHRVTLDGVFPLDGGGTLRDITVEVRTWGRHRSNATLVCHALTGDANVDAWWPGLFGRGRTLDASKRFVVAMNVLGGCSGTTGPTSVPAEGVAPYGGAFPDVSIRDMVAVQKAVLDQLGVTHLDLVIGGSMGGMQALEWAAMYPDDVGTIIPIAVGSEQSAWAVGISETQRQAITSDPSWKNGHYSEDAPPSSGLSTARMIAMFSYRSPTSFDARFGRSEDESGFAVQSYLRHHGESLVARFDANSYLTLVGAMDSHDLSRRRGPREAILRRIKTRALVVGISTDVLYPVAEVRQLASALPNARFAVLDSPHGHDSFLIDTEALEGLIAGFLNESSATTTTSAQGASWA
ncbi:MAG: homoserine O-acetyltransferase [Actinomycetota bacterium]|nr:homoserine O-acetyltransferase [Actinomycetota bacterium]